MQVPGHSGLGSGFSVVLGVVGAGVVVVGGAVGGCGLGGLVGAGPFSIPLLATRLRRGISWLAVSGLPVTPVRRSGPRVLIKDDTSGPDFLGGGLAGCFGGLGGGRGGG